ncbi:MAG: 30S ribosomal protein S16 [Bacteroidota bacterium]|jgi:small subunit ribosomal protein S16
MSTKIRLQRQGRKKRAFFHIVVADSRAPRDGRFIEKIGTYNPITNPATINLNLESSVKWLMTGAEPTDTARAILSYKGAMYKKHLQVGVVKGSITQEQADAKFAAWMEEKDNRIQTKRDKLANDKNSKRSDALKAESAKREAIAAKVLAKTSEVVVEESEEVVEGAEGEVEVEETASVAEETAAEETAAEETPAAEENTEDNA